MDRAKEPERIDWIDRVMGMAVLLTGTLATFVLGVFLFVK